MPGFIESFVSEKVTKLLSRNPVSFPGWNIGPVEDRFYRVAAEGSGLARLGLGKLRVQAPFLGLLVVKVTALWAAVEDINHRLSLLEKQEGEAKRAPGRPRKQEG